MSHYCCTPRLYQYIGSANNIEIGWLKPVTVCCFAVGGDRGRNRTGTTSLLSFAAVLNHRHTVLFCARSTEMKTKSDENSTTTTME